MGMFWWWNDVYRKDSSKYGSIYVLELGRLPGTSPTPPFNTEVKLCGLRKRVDPNAVLVICIALALLVGVVLCFFLGSVQVAHTSVESPESTWPSAPKSKHGWNAAGGSVHQMQQQQHWMSNSSTAVETPSGQESSVNRSAQNSRPSANGVFSPLSRADAASIIPAASDIVPNYT